MIDTHCHLTSKKYSEPVEEIIRTAKKVGVGKFITIGTSLKSNLENKEIANKFEDIYFAAGIYPHEDMSLSLPQLTKLFEEQISNMPNVVAIGECGIDITDRPGGRSLEDQIKLFEMQIAVAKENNLPVIIHNRNGDNHVIKTLRKHRDSNLRGVAHTYTSSWETAKKLIELNFMISFSGIITYPTGKNILETVKKIPLDKFLIETDAPYLAPQSHRSQINRPEYVKITAQKIAETKNLPLREIEESSSKNAGRLFGLQQN